MYNFYVFVYQFKIRKRLKINVRIAKSIHFPLPHPALSMVAKSERLDQLLGGFFFLVD
jgi:hypothetical protein